MLDKSMYYRDYKDLNDYLCGKPLSQSAEADKGEEASPIRKADDAATEKERGISSVICTSALPRYLDRNTASSMGVFFFALLRNAKKHPIEPRKSLWKPCANEGRSQTRLDYAECSKDSFA